MPTAADFRAEIARRRIHRYDLAAKVSLHPARLRQVLNEKLPLTPELASRIQRALSGTKDPRFLKNQDDPHLRGRLLQSHAWLERASRSGSKVTGQERARHVARRASVVGAERLHPGHVGIEDASGGPG